MMRLTILALLTLVATPALAQEQTLISGDIESGFFGGPVVRFTELIDRGTVLVGGRGGWIINHAFVIGGGGYGLATDIEVEAISADTTYYLEMGYGGFELAYVVSSSSLIHLSFHTLIGGGGVSFSESRFHIHEGGASDAFFVAEPGVNLILNITNHIRLGCGASYRYVSGVNLEGVTSEDLKGISGVLTLKFGQF